MKELFLITLGAKFDRSQVINYLSVQRGFGMWFYSMPHSFFIYSSVSAENIAKLIEGRFGASERYFVVKVANAEYYGWMPKDHWAVVNNLGAEKRYDLKFDGYFLDVADLPHLSGVYCVYRGVYDVERRFVTLNKLLYVGQAQDIYERHQNHESKLKWESDLSLNEQLCYTYAPIAVSELNRCEAAMIFLNQPKFNQAGKDSFAYMDTYVTVSGAIALLKNNVLAEQTK